MTRNRLTSVDILGITLGVIVGLLVIGSVVVISQQRMWVGGIAAEGARGWISSSGPERAEKDETVPAGVTEIEVHTVAGSIDVSGSTAATGVSVHSVKSAMTQAGLDSVRVDIQKRGTRLIVEEKHDQVVFGRSGTVSFQIVIPAGVKVVEAHSVSGAITLREVGADVDETLATVSGSVETNAARNLEASTTSGGIRFAMSGARLNVHSVSGSITGSATGFGAGSSATLSTVSGSVSLGVSGTMDATVSLHSVSGQVSCAFPVTIVSQKRNRLDGKIGSGAGSIDAGTVSGSISITRE
jgi:DUF4097 and DUF4098 domain-containing protein YvlB